MSKSHKHVNKIDSEFPLNPTKEESKSMNISSSISNSKKKSLDGKKGTPASNAKDTNSPRCLAKASPNVRIGVEAPTAPKDDGKSEVEKIIAMINQEIQLIINNLLKDMSEINKLRGGIQRLVNQNIPTGDAIHCLDKQLDSTRKILEDATNAKVDLYNQIYNCIYKHLLDIANYDYNILESNTVKNKIILIADYFHGFTDDKNKPSQDGGHFIKFEELAKPNYTFQHIETLEEYYGESIRKIDDKIKNLRDVMSILTDNTKKGYRVGNANHNINNLINQIIKKKSAIEKDYEAAIRAIISEIHEVIKDFTKKINIINKNAIPIPNFTSPPNVTIINE